MKHLRTLRCLKAGVLLAGLASASGCAPAHPVWDTATARRTAPPAWTTPGAGGGVSCANRAALRCTGTRGRGPGVNGALRTGGGSAGPSRASGVGDGEGRPTGGALTPAAFRGHLASCTAQYPVVQEAPPGRVVAVGLRESGLRPLAIHDNTTGRSHFPATPEQAVALASSLQGAGHRIDAGVMQVTQANWPAYGLTAETAFEPRANICAGARILAEAYRIERRAACRYNTGRPDCANGYPEGVDRAADALGLGPLATAGANGRR